MARVHSAKNRIAAITAGLSASVAGKLADFLETLAIASSSEEIGEIETSTRASRRGAKAAAAEEPAPRRRRAAKAEVAPVRGRRAAKAEVEDEEEAAPVRRTRRAKVEGFEGEVTIEDLYDFLDGFEGEPVEGGLRELKPQVEALGGDAKLILEMAAEESGEALTTKEKAEELGMFLAASNALVAKIIATLKVDAEAMDEVYDELEIDPARRASAAAKQIVVALNETGDEETPEVEEEDEDEVEEEVAPRRRRAAKAEVETKPTRRGRKAADLDDLDDLDD